MMTPFAFSTNIPTLPARGRLKPAHNNTCRSMPIRRCATTSFSALICKIRKATRSMASLQKALRQDAEPFRQAFYKSHPWGTPDQTIRRATELAHAFGTDEIIFVFKYGSMPIAAAERSMRLFAKEVMPALKALCPEPLTGHGRPAEQSISEQPTAR
jgi:hypothetical protein